MGLLLLLSAEEAAALGVTTPDAPLADGSGSDESTPLTFGSLYAIGDVRAIGDQAYRLVDTIAGGGLFTTNSDPSVVNIDPLTGEDAPIGTDVGFSAPLRRFIQTGVLNGDFATPPSDQGSELSVDNPLPYWFVSAGANHVIRWSPGDSVWTARRISFTTIDQNATATSTMYQWVPIPTSYGQQYRGLPSAYAATGGSGTVTLSIRYYDGNFTALTSLISANSATDAEIKFDGGLVPQLAEWALLTLTVASTTFADEVAVTEARFPFLPAEATIGLKSITSNINVTTSEVSVLSTTVPPDTFIVGSVYHLRLRGTISESVSRTVTLRLRVGPTTLTGTIFAAHTPSTSGSANGDGFVWDMDFVVKSDGASGAAHADSVLIGDGQPFGSPTGHTDNTTNPSLDTTVSNVLEATAVVSGANCTVTFRTGYIQCIMAS